MRQARLKELRIQLELLKKQPDDVNATHERL
jgi:hypothetical protein